MRVKLKEQLDEEKNEKLIDQMQFDLNRAERAVSNESKKRKKKTGEFDIPKRTWLKNVDYKNGGLLSDKKVPTKRKRNFK